ncbi:hypothetical protein ACDQ55_11445 [Chitinophaga sp. 30R24]|uniref:hypothetical protein n=1 Tax=Chitinophaga sp. 30R24 TaxID=3248838 RepID=UPI003B90B3D8
MKNVATNYAMLLALMAATAFTSCKKDGATPTNGINPVNGNQRAAVNAQQTSSPSYADLALRWAPVHYQDVDVTGTYSISGKSDYITNVNFDNDWIATNNWNNLANSAYPAYAHGYYSVVETRTHWFITYGFYHGRDWTDNPLAYYLDQHENDMEGAMFIIKKDANLYGTLLGIVTVVHSDFYSYVPDGSPLQGNEESVDGTLKFLTWSNYPHPVTAQSAKGHDLKAWPYNDIVGDGIIYWPSLTTAGLPTSADDRNVQYKLVDIFSNGGMWDQRFNTDFFYDAGGGIKSSYGSGNANAPWAWDDHDDKPGSGEIATDPANLTQHYFKNLGDFDLNYINNKYKGIQ